METSTEDRGTIAREHSALFSARLALARLACGSDVFHPQDTFSSPERTAWLAKAQRDLQSWLDKGGFCQGEEPASSVPRTGPDDAHEADEWVI